DERLRQKPLDLAGAIDYLLILFAQLIDAKNRNDVLQFAVTLQNLLHTASNTEVLFADNAGLQDTAVRRQRIDGGIDAASRDRALQVDEGIKVLESISRGRISRIVGGHVHRLH